MESQVLFQTSKITDDSTIKKQVNDTLCGKISSLIKDDKLFIKSHKGLKIICVNDILYCKASGCYTEIFLTNERPITACKRIKEMELLFTNYNIVRCHDSFLVNIQFIKEISGNPRMNHPSMIHEVTLNPQNNTYEL